MPDFRLRIRQTRHLLPVALVALGVCAISATPFAMAKTIEFSNVTSPNRPIDLGLPQPSLGVQGTVKFQTNTKDKAALRAAKQQEALRARAETHLAASLRAGQRIAALQELLIAAQGDEAALRAEIEARLVQQYKGGDGDDLQFLLAGDGLSDLINRTQLLKEQSERDSRTIAEHEDAIERIKTYERVLEELRDITGEQAAKLDERANRLDEVLVAARTGHDEAPDALDPKSKPKGVDGTWYVMDGAFTAQLFLPNAGSGYDGGTRTPARPATPAQIQRVLADKRIDLDASGYQDVLTGQIDGRLLDALSLAAAQFNYLKVTSLKRDHGVYTSSGNVSAHSFGCAADIGTIGSTYITPSAQVPGGEVQQAVMFFAALQNDLAPHQVISLFDLGGSTLSMGDHGDHIHLGYSC